MALLYLDTRGKRMRDEIYPLLSTWVLGIGQIMNAVQLDLMAPIALWIRTKISVVL